LLCKIGILKFREISDITSSARQYKKSCTVSNFILLSKYINFLGVLSLGVSGLLLLTALLN